METILDISVDPQSYEEQLPGYSSEFPYICSRALLSRYRRPFVNVLLGNTAVLRAGEQDGIE